jgi:hypothetical protein
MRRFLLAVERWVFNEESIILGTAKAFLVAAICAALVIAPVGYAIMRITATPPHESLSVERAP